MNVTTTTAARFAAAAAAAAALTLAGTQTAGASTVTSKPAASKPAAAQRTAPCTADNTKVTVTPVPRPLNHLLLTATNTGRTTCAAYHAPALRWDAGQQAPVTVLRDSAPQAVVILKPGQSAYAGIMSESPDGSGTHGHRVSGIDVYFTDAAGQGSVGGPARPRVPGTYFDDSAWVTFWQSTADRALSY
ncbi:DUF4232 domain-containing protein [Streptomyces caatingaensis]|uniref:DUF4232 domain-containing protein n=1 Tax=Streptomyces caatingaensis TaxID=1678637 RepID=A0A0K9XIL9_9ACTN|nr:DUF4232 domain-containing protein [Streptomyces caatingaensis]KNB53200.1 hypothetical protein AC230_07045 [Streptomyces caatingaensis]